MAMGRRVTMVVGVALAAGTVLASCTYSKDSDAVTPSALGTVPTVPTGGPTGVVGTLPPITAAPPTTAVTPAPTDPATAPTTAPATTRPVAPTTAATVPVAPPTTSLPPTTAASPATTPAGGTALVQAGAYGTRAAATDAVAKLAAKGFGGFEVSGDGPFRVVRRGLSTSAANKLVQALAAVGIAAYVRN